MRELVLRATPGPLRPDLRLFRRILRHLLERQLGLPGWSLGCHFVGDSTMRRINEHYLRHAGTTDVISFDQRHPADPATLRGELFVCVDEARRQARRYRTSRPDEVARYLVHGILHLCGYDDTRPARRRVMKREEDRLLDGLRRAFGLRPGPRRRVARSAAPA